MMSLVTNKPALYGALALCLVPATTHALEYQVGVGNSTLYTTNVGRTEDGEVTDLVQIPEVSVTASHDTPTLQLDTRYRFERRIYREDVFSDRNRLTGNTALTWNAVPERLQFFVNNTRTEATINSIAQDVEDNRQLVRSTTAGPRIILNPRSSDQFIFEYRYGLVSEEDSNFLVTDDVDADSTRSRFSASYLLGISENRSLTLQASREEVDFDDGATPDLDINNASLTYQSQGDRLALSATGGYTDIERSGGVSSVRGFTGNASLTWSLAATTNLTFFARRNLNDQSQDLQRGTAAFGQGTVIDNSGLNDVFEEDTVGVNFDRRFGRNNLALSYRFQTQDFTTVNRDEDESSYSFGIGRQHRPNVRSRLTARFIQRDFRFSGIEDDFLTLDGQIIWQATRRFGITLGARYEDRDSVAGNGQAFEEFIARININYNLLNRAEVNRANAR